MGKEHEDKIKVGITQGDINGIGLEVIMKAFSDPLMYDLCVPILYGSTRAIGYHKKALELEDFNFHRVDSAEQAHHKKFNLINVINDEPKIDLGESTADGGRFALESLKAAAVDLSKGKIDVVVTAPVDKHSLDLVGFGFPGQTEFFTDAFETKESLMILVGEKLKVALVTGHVPVKDIAVNLTKEKIVKKLKLFNASLKQDFGIRKPKIAVLSLNPHAGDGGLIGKEDEEIIKPALKEAERLNIFAQGPYPADGLFGSQNYAQFDGILAMYHDQGLAPFKALSFGGGVNFTAGLPVIRTSPDHGTAYDIAGKNQASPDSFRQAIYTACDIFRLRNEYKELTANPLKHGVLKEDN